MPAQHEDSVRLTHRFRDKAIINSLETYAADRRDHPEADSSADLQSLAFYFDQRFRATYLSQDETVRRTEVWFGGALIPPIGQRVPDDELRERWTVLQRYWEGPVEEPSIGQPPEPGVLQGESGIVWRLEYVGTP